MRDMAGSAAAPAARCRNFRRGSFILNLPSHHSITSSARARRVIGNPTDVDADAAIGVGEARLPQAQGRSRVTRRGNSRGRKFSSSVWLQAKRLHQFGVEADLLLDVRV